MAAPLLEASPFHCPGFFFCPLELGSSSSTSSQLLTSPESLQGLAPLGFYLSPVVPKQRAHQLPLPGQRGSLAAQGSDGSKSLFHGGWDRVGSCLCQGHLYFTQLCREDGSGAWPLLWSCRLCRLTSQSSYLLSFFCFTPVPSSLMPAPPVTYA